MIDRFNVARFEAALPKGFWASAGMQYGEYCYKVQVNPAVAIMVRSSIDQSGWAGETGKDSIRFVLVDNDGNSLGGKMQRWVTRVAGWEERMKEQLRAMWRIANKLGKCPKCGGQRVARKVKKEGPNKGRIFFTCPPCNSFEWMEE